MPNITPIRRGVGECRVPGCTNTRRSSAAPYCTVHHSRARVHGDPQQSLVTREDLGPYESRVRLLAKNHDEDLIRSSVTEIARRLNAAAEAELAQYSRGAPMNRYRVTALDQIAKVSKSVDAFETATTISALFLMRQKDPRRFVSDPGMIGQLVRQYRAPAGIARGYTQDPRTGRDVGWFRPLPQKTTSIMGTLIVEAYKPWLVRIMTADRALQEEEERVSRDLAKAFSGPSAVRCE